MTRRELAAELRRCYDEIDNTQRENSVILAAADQLEADWEDTERLDYIIEASNAGEGWLDDGVWDATTDYYDECDEDPKRTIRAAIDAARKGERND